MPDKKHQLSADEIDVAAGDVIRGAWTGSYSPYIHDIIWPDRGFSADAQDIDEVWDIVRTQSTASQPGCFLIGDIRPEVFRPALGNIAIIDVLEDGRDGQYRLYGTKVAHALGSDYTLARVSDMNNDLPRDLALFYRSGYRAAFLQKAPLFTHHSAPLELSKFGWYRLMVPVLGDDHSVVRFLVTVVAKIREASTDELYGYAMRQGVDPTPGSAL